MTIARGQMKRQLYADGGVKTLMDLLEPSTRRMVERKRAEMKMSPEDREVMEMLMEKQKGPNYQYDEKNMYKGPRDMRMTGGITNAPIINNRVNAFGGFGGFFDSIGDVLGGAADVVGDVVGGIGDVIGDVDLGDVATAAAFIYGGPQAAAMVNQATGGTGNKYIDTGLQLYSMGSGGSGGGVFGTGSGGTFGTPSGIPSIPGVPSDITQALKTYSTMPTNRGPGKIGGNQQPSTTGDILGTLLNVGLSAYGAYEAKKEQEKINRLKQQQYDEEKRRYDEFLARQARKRRQYAGEESLPGLTVSNRAISKSDVLGRRGVKEGGITNLNIRTNPEGVKEIDYRQKGGFVPPVGIKEKADDIPAMLSNNEFVFTADAVRGAGKGDVNEGAKKMYALMKKLESGGRV